MKPLDQDRQWIDAALDTFEERIVLHEKRLETTCAAALLWQYQIPQKEASLLATKNSDAEREQRKRISAALFDAVGVPRSDYREMVRSLPGYVSPAPYWSFGAWPKPLPISDPLAERLAPIVKQFSLRDEAPNASGARPEATAPEMFENPEAVGSRVLDELGATNKFFVHVTSAITRVNVSADWDTFKPFFKSMGTAYYKSVIAPRKEAQGTKPEGAGTYWAAARAPSTAVSANVCIFVSPTQSSAIRIPETSKTTMQTAGTTERRSRAPCRCAPLPAWPPPSGWGFRSGRRRRASSNSPTTSRPLPRTAPLRRATNLPF